MDTYPIDAPDGWLGRQPETPTFLRVTPAPLTVGIVGLADLLGFSPKTVETLRSRDPGRLPPAYLPPGAKAPRWIVADVIEWLRLHPEQRREKPSRKRRPGRPSKVEQAAAARAAQEVGNG